MGSKTVFTHRLRMAEKIEHAMMQHKSQWECTLEPYLHTCYCHRRSLIQTVEVATALAPELFEIVDLCLGCRLVIYAAPVSIALTWVVSAVFNPHWKKEHYGSSYQGVEIHGLNTAPLSGCRDRLDTSIDGSMYSER